MREPELTAVEKQSARQFVERVAVAFHAGTLLESDGPGRDGLSAVAPADLVWACRACWPAASLGEDLETMARLARKVLVIVVRNPERIGARGVGCDTLVLAPILWSVGRVRDHAYLGLPRGVDGFLAILGNRLSPTGARSAPAASLIRRTARLHAFVVDTAPRTPQARRRLRSVDGAPTGV